MKLIHLFYILGILCILYCIAIFSYVGMSSKFHFIWGAIGLALILVPRFMDLLKANKDHLPKPLLYIGVLVVALLGCSFIFIETLVITKANEKPKQNARYVLVLGAQVNGSKVSKALRYRLEEAKKYSENNKDAKLIVSGGKGMGENVSEAQAMKEWLVEHGVEETRIIMEEKSTNTRENIQFSKELCKLQKDTSIVVISNGFHMYRATYLCKKNGLENSSSLGASSDIFMIPTYYLREYLAVMKDWILN